MPSLEYLRYRVLYRIRQTPPYIVLRVLHLRQLVKTHLAKREKIKVIIGAGDVIFPGWIMTDLPLFDILKSDSWTKIFPVGSIDRILAEHIMEHLYEEQFRQFLRIVDPYLRADGFIRMAVPDGFHADPTYIENVRPGSNHPTAKDHKMLYDYLNLERILSEEGYECRLLEYFDENKQFHAVSWDVADGKIRRSATYDERNKAKPLSYTSLIADLWPRKELTGLHPSVGQAVQTSSPRISFGIIVLNGEPFNRYTLRALYPFAHEIIVVEGAAPGAANVATPDGHSLDGTLEVLQQFKAEEDSENKVKIITQNGFWSEKDEMSQAYAACATGNYLWQVDIDEFYQPDDIERIIAMLRNDPDITAVSFKTRTFWGSPDYIVDGWRLRRGAGIFHRLFKWGVGYRYINHRPPTIYNDKGHDLRRLKWVKGNQLARQGIFMYHYSLLLPKQVTEKSDYYGNTFANISGGMAWAKNHYMTLAHPFHVHNVYKYPSWLIRFKGKTPPQIQSMWQDIQTKKIRVDLRQTDDIEYLLRSPIYKLQRPLVKITDYPIRLFLFAQRVRKYALRRLKGLGVGL